MVQKKKVSILALVENALVLFFLLWILFMPWEEMGSLIQYHIALAAAIGDMDEDVVFAAFELLFLLSWLITFIYFIINTVYSVRCLANPDRMTYKNMKKAFAFSMVIVTFIVNIIAMVLLYFAALTYPPTAMGLYFLFALVLAVIIVGSVGKSKTKKAFLAPEEPAK